MVLIICFLCAMALYAIFMPKNLSKIEIYATSIFALFFGRSTDEILDVKKNWYGYFGPGVQYLGIIMQIIIYTTVNVLFLNYFPFKKTNRSKLFHILGWSLFSIIFERITLKTKFFYYTKWKSSYSLLLYPIIFLILAANLKFVRYLLKIYPK